MKKIKTVPEMLSASLGQVRYRTRVEWSDKHPKLVSLYLGRGTGKAT